MADNPAQIKLKVAKLIEKDQSYLDTLAKVLNYHDTKFKCLNCGSRNLVQVSKYQYKCEDCGATTVYIGFHTMDLGVPPHHLQQLLQAGLLEVTYRSSRGGVHYKLKYPDIARELVGNYEPPAPDVDNQSVVEEEKEEIQIPDDLFSIIEGYDDLKQIILKSLRSSQPVHILLVGPPASAKSLFLEELNRLPGSYYTLAGTSTKAGLRDLIAVEQPRFLLIDELDKVKTTSDLSVLLNWMESGKISIVMHKRREVIEYKGWVFAAANRDNKIPPELLSRFLIFYLKPYDTPTFRRVVKRVLVDREGKDEKLADYIAKKVIELGSRDVRDAVKLARLCNTKEEVDLIAGTLKRYRRA